MSFHNGLVLSGGGAFAAYEVGVLKALMTGAAPFTRYRRIDPEVVTGASAGSYNGAMLVSRWASDPAEAIADMERVWLEQVPGGACDDAVYRWRGSPFVLFDFDCFFENPARFFWLRVEDAAFFTTNILRRARVFVESRDPIEQRFLELLNFSNLISTYPFPGLIRRTVDFEQIRRSDIKFQAIATNWVNGESREFHNEDLDEQNGPLIIMASSALPGIFPPVDIPPHVFVDGGILMNTPLAPAIHAGATHLHVIYLDPDIGSIPLSDLETTLNTLQRTLAITFAGIVKRDIEDAKRINKAIELWESGVRSGDLTATGARDVGRIADVFQRLESGRRLRKISIHQYRPRTLLGGALGMLNFSADQSRDLIERGYRETVDHDCARNGCVVPAEGPDELDEPFRAAAGSR